MPRQRLTAEQAEFTGAAAHNPKRFADRANAPKPEGPIGDPPNYFEEKERDLWGEVVDLVPAGVLTSADRLLVEVTVGLLLKLRERYIKPVEIGHLRACLGSMGLTPADRTRVTGSNEQEEDPLDALDDDGYGEPN
jgi:hypothetical protein